MSGKKIASKVLQKIRAQMEEVEELDELSHDTLRRYRMRAKSIADNETDDLNYRSKGRELAARKTYGGRMAGIEKAKVMAKEEADMLDTSLSDVDASAKGEVYKKTSEKTTAPTKPTGTKTGVTSTGSGEAYNTTPGTKRLPAVEHAVRSVMERTYQVRKIYAEASEISIGTPEQRQDWMNVEQGRMDVVDYFNKYRITGDE